MRSSPASGRVTSTQSRQSGHDATQVIGTMSTNTPLSIDNSGALILKAVLPQPQWYAELSIKIPMAAIEVSENLSEIKAPEKPKDITEASIDTWRNELVVWGLQPYTLEVSAKQKEAIKICLDKTLNKGGFPVTSHARFDQNLNVVPGFKSLFYAIYFPKAGEAPESKHDLKLTKASAFLLQTLTERDGWYDSSKAVQAAFEIQSKIALPDTGPGTEEDGVLWTKEAVVLGLSEGQREVAKACVKKYMDKGALRLTREVRNLVTQLGLDE